MFIIFILFVINKFIDNIIGINIKIPIILLYILDIKAISIIDNIVVNNHTPLSFNFRTVIF